MSDLHLQEAGPPVQCVLDDAVAQRVASAGVATVAPLGQGRWELRAGQKVGVVRIGTTTFWVRPKITIDRLLWLMGWARRPVFEAPGPVTLDEAHDLVPALAEAFCLQAERALRAGLLQGYREVEGTEPVLRGRLRSEDQLRRRYGLAVPLLVRYDDFLVDVPENQIVKAAATRLLGSPGVGPNVRRRLRTLRGLLVDVTDLPAAARLPVWHPTRLNGKYHDALWLGEIALANRSIDQIPGTLRIDGFLIDLYQVFENFVTDTLSAALAHMGGRCQAQDRHTLDEEGLVDIRPDLVWRIDGQPVAVIDAKYKAEQPAGFPQADLYQALAYATAYGLDEAHLVYAKGNEVAHGWTVRHAGVRISAHTLDLEQTPTAILNQVTTLACRIAAPSHWDPATESEGKHND